MIRVTSIYMIPQRVKSSKSNHPADVRGRFGPSILGIVPPSDRVQAWSPTDYWAMRPNPAILSSSKRIAVPHLARYHSGTPMSEVITKPEPNKVIPSKDSPAVEVFAV